MAEVLEALHLLGATGKARYEAWNGKQYLVVPTIALMEGVIHAVNAGAPEFVPKTLIETDPHLWDDQPIMLGHPVRGGKHCSAHDDGILAAQRFGTLRNTYAKDGKLSMESWVDPLRLKELGRDDVLKRLENGDPIGVSVGALVSSDKKPGAHGEKKYSGTWLAYKPDHLAYLPDGRGACSLEMGCGTHRAAMRVCAEGLVIEDPRSAAGARHSAADMKAIQGVHDHACTLGAKCESSNTQFMSMMRGLEGKSLDERIQAVSRAVEKAYGSSGALSQPSMYAYPQTVYDDHVVVRRGDKLYSVNYMMEEGEVEFTSDPVEVKQEYVAAAVYTDCETCDGTGQVKKDGKQEDCPTCEGKGEIRAAAEKPCGCHTPALRAATIKHEGGKWALYTKDGARKLGTHDTEAEAVAHERAIEAAKKRRALELQGAGR